MQEKKKECQKCPSLINQLSQNHSQLHDNHEVPAQIHCFCITHYLIDPCKWPHIFNQVPAAVIGQSLQYICVGQGPSRFCAPSSLHTPVQ